MNEKPKKIIDSQILEHYKLKKEIISKLKHFVKMFDYMVSCGRTLPNEIRLFSRDYVAINNLVINQSAGKFCISDVTFNGHYIISQDHCQKSFSLDP